jgi:hypothetical protein
MQYTSGSQTFSVHGALSVSGFVYETRISNSQTIYVNSIK